VSQQTDKTDLKTSLSKETTWHKILLISVIIKTCYKKMPIKTKDRLP